MKKTLKNGIKLRGTHGIYQEVDWYSGLPVQELREPYGVMTERQNPRITLDIGGIHFRKGFLAQIGAPEVGALDKALNYLNENLAGISAGTMKEIMATAEKYLSKISGNFSENETFLTKTFGKGILNNIPWKRFCRDMGGVPYWSVPYMKDKNVGIMALPHRIITSTEHMAWVAMEVDAARESVKNDATNPNTYGLEQKGQLSWKSLDSFKASYLLRQITKQLPESFIDSLAEEAHDIAKEATRGTPGIFSNGAYGVYGV